jgi:type 1 fimbria pilin
MSNGGVYINGWDRSEYSVKTCKAAPADDANAANTLHGITTTNGNGQIVISGPGDHEWLANLIVMAPRLSNLNIESMNGPLSLRDLAGVIHLTATNGPIGLYNVGGAVDTRTTNGPITLKGATGDEKITAVNGPVHLELTGTRWDGPGIELSTQNGPLSVSIPDGYSSGISIQTSDRSPVKCSAPACSGATRNPGSGAIRIGGGEPVVRLSTANGPLSIQAAKK